MPDRASSCASPMCPPASAFHCGITITAGPRCPRDLDARAAADGNQRATTVLLASCGVCNALGNRSVPACPGAGLLAGESSSENDGVPGRA